MIVKVYDNYDNEVIGIAEFPSKKHYAECCDDLWELDNEDGYEDGLNSAISVIKRYGKYTDLTSEKLEDTAIYI